MSMTYRNLLNHINDLEEEQLDMVVMVDVDEEFFPAEELKVDEEVDRLEDGHPYLTIT